MRETGFYWVKPKSDDWDLEVRGFVKTQSPNSDVGLILAEFGICVNYHENQEDISVFGVPLIRESEYEAILEVDQTSEEEMVELSMAPRGPSIETKYGCLNGNRGFFEGFGSRDFICHNFHSFTPRDCDALI